MTIRPKSLIAVDKNTAAPEFPVIAFLVKLISMPAFIVFMSRRK